MLVCCFSCAGTADVDLYAQCNVVIRFGDALRESDRGGS